MRKMIRARDGEIELNGELTELSSDIAGILHTYRDALTRKFDEEAANQLFAIVGRLAVMPRPGQATPEELKQMEQYADDFAQAVHEAAMRKESAE